MRRFAGDVSLVLLAVLGGCASVFDADKPFELIKPQDGWVRLDVAPPESSAMIAAAGEAAGVLLEDRHYKVTWFQRGKDDYLAYFQTHSYVNSEPGCEDRDFEVQRADGGWIAVTGKLTHIIVCAD
jgi:hypothetical protein